MVKEIYLGYLYYKADKIIMIQNINYNYLQIYDELNR